MPWEKLFDEGTALNGAMHLFWKKGFSATSIVDLTRVMKINKASLYNTFGNKKSVFLKTLLNYDIKSRQSHLREFSNWEDPIAAIVELFNVIVSESIADHEQKGCFLVNTALELHSHDPEIQKMVKKALAEFEEFFRSRLDDAKLKQLLDKNIDVESEAKSLLSQIIGIRVLARGTYSADALTSIAKAAVSHLKLDA